MLVHSDIDLTLIKCSLYVLRSATPSQMHIVADTLDDLLRDVLTQILKRGYEVSSTKGPNREIFGVLLELSQPLARLSRTESKGLIFSALGELFWYLSGSADLSFIEYYIPTYRRYSDDGQTLWGAYGPRLFNMRGIDQISQIRKLLNRKPASRRAVIQLYNAEDIIVEHEDIPCTCTMQFTVRAEHLHMFVTMRSNDVYLGLPHDVFAFTMIQELLARELAVELGTYKHAVGSLHLYDTNLGAAQNFLDEGWQSTMPMPSMPIGDPWPDLVIVKDAENELRKHRDVEVSTLPICSYWKDILKLLRIYALTRDGADRSVLRRVVEIKETMDSDFYYQYVRRREKRHSRHHRH